MSTRILVSPSNISSFNSLGLISSDVFQIFELSVSICAFGFISIVGVIGNVFNLIIFVKQSLKDRMTIGLFSLSLTDLVVSLLELAMSTIYLTNTFFPSCTVDLWALAYVCFGWALYAGYLVSGWITAMISVERCLCVVVPFKVKLVLTRGRCAAVVIMIYLIHIGTLLPIYIAEKMEWVAVDTQSAFQNCSLENSLYYTITFTDFSADVEKALDITAGFFLFLASQAILLVCSVWMTYALGMSSKVRQNRECESKSFVKVKIMESNLSTKEKKLIKLVLSLAVLQTLCNLPRLVLTIFYNVCTDPSLMEDKQLNTVLWTIASLFNQICCTSNTFCYYFLHSKHRELFVQTIRCNWL